MIISTLFFIVLVVASAVTLAVVVASALRGRLRTAFKLFAIYSVCLVCYVGIVVMVSLMSPQHVIPVGEDWCFDDWCLAVENVTLAPELVQGERIVRASGQFYVIRLRLSNHARGRAQRASSAAVHLIDGQGHWYDVTRQGQEAWEAQYGPTASLTSTLPVGQSLIVVQVFDLPDDSRHVGLTVEHPVGPSPGLLIIGDDASLFHKPTIVRLP